VGASSFISKTKVKQYCCYIIFLIQAEPFFVITQQMFFFIVSECNSIKLEICWIKLGQMWTNQI